MHLKHVRLGLATSLVCLAAAQAQAQVITFEGTTTNGASRQLDVATAGTIPSNFGPSLVDFAGYDWVGLFVNKPLVSVNRPRLITGVTQVEDDPGVFINEFTTTPVDAGFHRSIVSGDTVAFTQAFDSGTFGSISARDGAPNFNFFSTYLTSGFRDNITVSVIGRRDGATVASQTLTVGDDGPTKFTLNFLNIDSIEFQTSGGTFLYPNGTTVGSFLNPSNAFRAPVLVFDNIAIAPVPEPGSIAMMLAGMGIVGAMVRRRTAR